MANGENFSGLAVRDGRQAVGINIFGEGRGGDRRITMR